MNKKVSMRRDVNWRKNKWQNEKMKRKKKKFTNDRATSTDLYN